MTQRNVAQATYPNRPLCPECSAPYLPASAFCDECGAKLPYPFVQRASLVLVPYDDCSALHFERPGGARWVPVSVPQPLLQQPCHLCGDPVRYGFLNIERPGGAEIVVCNDCSDVREDWREDD